MWYSMNLDNWLVTEFTCTQIKENKFSVINTRYQKKKNTVLMKVVIYWTFLKTIIQPKAPSANESLYKQIAGV